MVIVMQQPGIVMSPKTDHQLINCLWEKSVRLWQGELCRSRCDGDYVILSGELQLSVAFYDALWIWISLSQHNFMASIRL